ncbi:VOC family protein [Sphingomonas sp. MMS24-J13]|uniref:VOC family protein n=1 Tax=Sphingomonas sp. MMS24-J13 TaxID=3238686 RepID=UPI00385112A3
MSSPVVHFEIGSADAAAAASFYTSVFGWSFADVGPAKLIVGGAEGGPSGMLNALGHPPENYVMVYIQVDDVEASLELIAKCGGACMVPPQPLPDGRRFAWIKDPAGNLIGLLTPLP